MKDLQDIDDFCLAFGTKKLNFLEFARRNSLLLVSQEYDDPSAFDDLFSPIEIEWGLPSQNVSSSHAPTVAHITDIDSSDSSFCTASTDIFDDVSLEKTTSPPPIDLRKTATMIAHSFPVDQDFSIVSQHADALSAQDFRFKPFHEEKWTIRYKELLLYQQENGHAAVPHTYPRNQQLARWIKR